MTRTGRPVLPVAARKAEPTGKIRVSTYLSARSILDLDALARRANTTRGRAVALCCSFANQLFTMPADWILGDAEQAARQAKGAEEATSEPR